MAEDALQRRVDELRNNIDQWSYEYHVLDSPTVTDADYDAAFNELRHLEEEHPERPDQRKERPAPGA